MEKSMAHAGSKLQIFNRDLMAGVDESIVAYFPFTHSIISTNNIKPFPTAKYIVDAGSGIKIQSLQYKLSDLNISLDSDWTIFIRCYLSQQDLSGWTKRRTILSVGKNSSISIGTGASESDLGCIYPYQFSLYTYYDGVETTAASPISMNPTAEFNTWCSFALTYNAESYNIAIYAISDKGSGVYEALMPCNIDSVDEKLFVGGSSSDNGSAQFLMRDMMVYGMIFGPEETRIAHRYNPHSLNERVVLL